MKNYYKILGVKEYSSIDNIKKKYRELAKKYHPDVNNGNKEFENKFKEISEAYDVLGNEKKKQKYDENLRFNNDDFSRNFQFHNHFNDFFDFSNIRFRYQDEGDKPPNLKLNLELKLEECFKGCEKKYNYNINVLCEKCNGKKYVEEKDISLCSTCNGLGKIASSTVGLLFIKKIMICPDCHGEGSIIINPCPQCSGSGFKKENKKSSIKIPKGIQEGFILKKEKEGHIGENGSKGDCLIKIVLAKHDLFYLNNYDIYCDLNVPFQYCLTGGEIKVPTLHGTIKHKIPPNSGTNYSFTLKNMGFTVFNTQEYGDMHVRCIFEIPKKMDDDIIEKLNKIEVNEENFPNYINTISKFG